jgi:hypothetical protein
MPVVAQRRCLVCDWSAEVVEPPETDEIGPPCAACQAPTERVAILGEAARTPNPHAAALGRLGGMKGGRARAAALSARRRREIAQKAARARWKVR